MKYLRRWVVVVLLCGAPLARADDMEIDAEKILKPIILEPGAADRVPADVRRLMQDREYANAIKAIDKAAKVKDAPVEYLGYLKGRALHLQKKYADAAKAFDAMVKKHPQGKWARRARFAKALALARLGDYRAAEQIYREEAKFLLSAERKGEIADIYLEFADAYFKPAKETQKPDYNKALKFYREALKVGAAGKAVSDKLLKVELRVGQCFQKLGKHADAAREYQAYLKKHAKSKFDVEARFRLGEVQLASGNAIAARRTWQDLLAAHLNSEDDRIPEASYNLAKTFGIPRPLSDEDLSRGVAALETFLKRFPAHKLASEAHLNIAQSYSMRGRHEEAVKSLQRFLKDDRFAASEQTPLARTLLGQAFLAQNKFSQAISTWREYLAKHPTHKSWSEVQRAVITTEYLTAMESRKEKKFAQARKQWQTFLEKYPLDPRAAGILYALGQMNYEQKQWEAAIADWRRLTSKYPKTNEASRAQYAIGSTLEAQLKKLAEAIKEYRKVTWGSYASVAKQRIALLSATHLAIATPRAFRSGETPKIKLVARNIESVTVEVYTVDLETYFRKMHHSHQVDALDIALIDPDKTFKFKIPKYAKHRLIESEIEIPLPAAGDAKKPPSGVMAVTISSKTLEATTLVLQSDLDMIVKSSRDEVFVFAKNMRTGKPWPGVRLLISTGENVIAEVKTGEDGVFRASYKELKSAGDVRVFAVADGHVASNVVGLQGIGVAQGLTDKGYIYTDRPAYRAGQVVHVRGILRHAKDDAYTIPASGKYSVDVLDNRNRMIWQKEITLGKFGSLHANFVLPPGSPQGQYRVVVRHKDGRSYQGSFQVHAFQLEPVRLQIETKRNVYYRGEEITGTITVKYYYGAPLVGREIRYQFATSRIYTAKTNDQGEVEFKLATRELRESQVIPLVVTLPERNLTVTKNLVLATQGFSLAVTTVRGVYLAGETFEVRVKATDAEGKPLARKLELQVLEQTNVQGRLGERSVETHDVATDKEGLARHTLRLESGGDYILRVVGVDRFENSIIGGMVVRISDDKDRVRLRILADKHTFKAGDETVVQVHWREEPALALITFEGARVLDYRLVHLQKGANKLPIKMAAMLAPNFELSISVMTDARAKKGDAQPPLRFHTASSPFTVQRDLRVTVETRRKKGAKGPVRPGEAIEIILTTKDASGKPISAEVSLAMVERSLLDLFDPAVGPIGEFFRGQPRRSAFRSTSSVTFQCTPATRPINPELLKEEERLALKEDEKLRMLAFGGGGYIGFERNGRFSSGAGINSDLGVLRSIVQEEPGSLITGRQRAGAQMNDPFPANFLFLNGGANAPPAPAATAQQPPGEGQRLNSGRGMGGGQNGDEPDFDSLIDLIQNSIAPDSWQDVGGDGSIAPFEGNLSLLVSQGNLSLVIAQFQKINLGKRKYAFETITLLGKNGEQKELNFAQLGDPNAPANVRLFAQLAKEGAVILAAAGASETGYWNPSIVTDAKGRATLKITVPDRSTAWKILAKGVTLETLAGEATSELTVKKDLFGELKLPLAFTDGDKVQVVVSVHNDLVAKGQIEVTLKTTIGGKTVSETKKININKKGLRELTFNANVKRPDDKPSGPGVAAKFELIVSAAGVRDVTRRSVPIRPDGMPVFVTASGSAQSDTTAFIEPPKDIPIAAPSLQIVIGPTIERSLLDIVLGPAPLCQIYGSRYAAGLERSTSDLMASLGLQQLLKTTRQVGGPQSAAPESAALDARIRSAVSLLIASQHKSGGWSWTGRGGNPNRYASARAYWAMSLAQAAGYPVSDDVLASAATYLTGQVVATANSDYESKSVLLHALAVSGRGDFTLANRLYRGRQSLSDAALAYLALAMVEMDREPMAADLLKLLEQRKLDSPAKRTTVSHSIAWNASATETRAIYALAAEGVAAYTGKAKTLVEGLMAHRTGHRWSPEKATGPAALAVCRHFAHNQFKREHYKLAIFVNKVPLTTLDIGDDALTRTIDVPANLLEKGRQRIRFQLTGRGRFSYQCIYGGFVPTDKLKSTTKAWSVSREYQPAQRELDGQTIPRGFGGVLTGSFKSFRNPLTQLPVGARGHVQLKFQRPRVDARAEHRETLVITEPLPSGTTVIAQSIEGDFDRYEIAAGEIVFYVGSRSGGSIRYDIHGYLPGSYRAGPTVMRDAYRPDQLAVATPKKLTVLPLGAASSDKYRLTPVELYQLGTRHFAKKNFALAGKHLTDLADHWNLKVDVYRKTARMLLEIHLETGPAAAVVKYFEINIEKWPETEIPLGMITKVGAAYHEIGEYERSYLVFRAGVEGSFARDSQVSGFLESEHEFLRGVRVMDRLLGEYPPEPYVASARYALAQRIYAKAAEAERDAKLREKKILPSDVVRQALAMLDNFLTAYPEDPAADQAAFSIGVALLELKSYQQAIAACQRFAKRYSQSEFLDSYWYTIGYSHFALGQHKQALQMCDKVSTVMHTDRRSGRELESKNKWRAIYIMGQIHHSLGEAAAAIREYTRVKGRFADARQAIEYFARKDISLPEVTTVQPGKPAAVKLTFRNVPKCDVKVYRIDLMKFTLLRRNLDDITKINLAGIRPSFESTIKLGDGKDYRDREHELKLALKKVGAYLVVCRGDDLHASGLVLVTPLKIDVQQDASSGRVRATVKEVAGNRFVANVHVKIIGSRNREFHSGETDLRGIYVADAIRGTTTIVARADGGRYAFFRGTTELGPVPLPKPSRKQPDSSKSKDKPDGKKGDDLLKGLKGGNEGLQKEQQQELEKLYKQKGKGVRGGNFF